MFPFPGRILMGGGGRRRGGKGVSPSSLPPSLPCKTWQGGKTARLRVVAVYYAWKGPPSSSSSSKTAQSCWLEGLFRTRRYEKTGNYRGKKYDVYRYILHTVGVAVALCCIVSILRGGYHGYIYCRHIRRCRVCPLLSCCCV